MTLSATRHFDASLSLIEWFVEERGDELTDEQMAALEVYHDLLIDTSEELWDTTPPKLSEKVGDAPSDRDEAWWEENY